MDGLAKKLNITDYQSWYAVSNAVIRSNGGGGLLHKFNGSPTKLLQHVYPEYPIELWSKLIYNVSMARYVEEVWILE